MLPSRRLWPIRDAICHMRNWRNVMCVMHVMRVMCVCVCLSVCLSVCVCVCLSVCVRHVKTSQNILFVIVHHLFQEISLIDDTTMKTLPKLRKLLPEQDIKWKCSWLGQREKDRHPCAFTQEAFFSEFATQQADSHGGAQICLAQIATMVISSALNLVQWNSGTHSLFPVLKRLTTCPEIPLASLIASDTNASKC